MTAGDDEADEDEEDEEEDGLDVHEGPPSPTKSVVADPIPAKARQKQKILPVFSVVKPGAVSISKPPAGPSKAPPRDQAGDDFFDIDDIPSPSASEAGPGASTIEAKRRPSLHKASQPKPRRRLSIPPRSLSLTKPPVAPKAVPPKARRRPAARKPKAVTAAETSGEVFDLENISSCTDD